MVSYKIGKFINVNAFKIQVEKYPILMQVVYSYECMARCTFHDSKNRPYIA